MDFHLLDNGEILPTQTDVHFSLSRENAMVISDKTMKEPFEENKTKFVYPLRKETLFEKGRSYNCSDPREQNNT